MKLHINGKEQEVDSVLSAGELLNHLEVKRDRVAVVINENVIRRAELDAAELQEGDTIEIITMVGGG